MAYHGLLHLVKALTGIYQKPKILEIGIDKGQSFIPMLHGLYASKKEEFLLMGIDIKLNKSVCTIVDLIRSMEGDYRVNMRGEVFNSEKRQCGVIYDSSLNTLPAFIKNEFIFDIILLDGDHNYSTVFKELNYIEKITHHSSIVLCDDYLGRWSEEDLYYEDRSLETPTQRKKSEKQGVKAAVDDFLLLNKNWKIWDYNTIMPGVHPPVFLHKGILDDVIFEKLED